jgi:hypothetical protein
MPDEEGLLREVLRRRVWAKRREPVAEQWWCSRCQALRGAAELEVRARSAESGETDGGHGCRGCGATVEDLPF